MNIFFKSKTNFAIFRLKLPGEVQNSLFFEDFIDFSHNVSISFRHQPEAHTPIFQPTYSGPNAVSRKHEIKETPFLTRSPPPLHSIPSFKCD